MILMLGLNTHTPQTLCQVLEAHEVMTVWSLGDGSWRHLGDEWRSRDSRRFWSPAEGLRGWGDWVAGAEQDPWFDERGVFNARPLSSMKPEHRSGWRTQEQVDYCWYTTTYAFQRWIAWLDDWHRAAPKESTVAIACHEQYWFNCRRGMIADCLTWGGTPVAHIESKVFWSGEAGEWELQRRLSPHDRIEKGIRPDRKRFTRYPGEVLLSWADPSVRR